MDTSPHKSDFVLVNGIKLHYLDWGGKGEALIFLTGMGNSAHCFDGIAPRFADQFHVLALTRRGQGESDYPESGYDLDTLVDDILDFMDMLNIDKANLAGHSLAGVEMTRFIEKYPERVSRLIYLDAVYDPKGRKEIMMTSPVNSIQPPIEKSEFESVDEYIEYIKYLRPDLDQIWNETYDTTVIYDLEKNADGKFVEKDTSAIARQMLESVTAYDHRHANIKVPVLWFSAITNPMRPSYFTDEQRKAADDFHRNQWLPYQQSEIAQFKQAVPQATIIEIPNSNHSCYISDEDLVYAEILTFLLT
ncbi:MAG: alpha/beta hydrolase [Chloroflexota bacterium]